MDKKEVVNPSFYAVEQLRLLKKRKKHDVINDLVKEWLSTSECPFTTALNILQKSLNQNSFSNYMSEVLVKNIRPYNTKKNTASKKVKIGIAKNICRFRLNNRKNLVNSFRLDQLDLKCIQTIAKKHLKRNDSESFFIYHELFNLHDAKFTEEIFHMMISKGDVNFLLRYAKNSIAIQTKFMQSVDKLIGDHYSKTSADEHWELSTRLVDFATKSKERYPTAYSKVKTKNTEAFLMSNKKAEKSKNFIEIKYLLNQWKNKQISGSLLENSVLKFVGGNYDLQEEVARLIEYEFKDKKRANLLRQRLQLGAKRTPIWSDEEEIPISDHNLKLAIPIESVFFVDSKIKLVDCFNYFKNSVSNVGSTEKLKKRDKRLKNSSLTISNPLPIGFHSKWVSKTFKNKEKDLALIQLAVNDRVYVIDVVHFLLNNMQPLKEFIKSIFGSKHFIILGFDLSQVLYEYFNGEELWSRETNQIDFLKFRSSEFFTETCGDATKFYPGTGKQMTGLSRLCKQVKFVLTSNLNSNRFNKMLVNLTCMVVY